MSFEPAESAFDKGRRLVSRYRSIPIEEVYLTSVLGAYYQKICDEMGIDCTGVGPSTTLGALIIGKLYIAQAGESEE
jgi:hypothetical protein